MIPWQTTRPPRDWQVRALNAVIAYLHNGGRNGMISAIMGAGKTALIAELCAVCVHWRWQVVVSVPSQKLVRQTAAALRQRLGDGVVGTYWQHGRDTHTPVIVACSRSFDRLANEPIDIDLWIADEAHGTESPGVLAWHAALQPRRTIGLSATPYRADERAALSLFADLVYSYSAADALRDGVLVPWRFPDPATTGEQGDDAVDLDDLCTAWIQARGGHGIISAHTIDDAEEYAATLCDAGVRAMAVHSALPAATNDARLAALEAGELDCVVHVSVLVEGVDLPWIRWMCLRRRRGSRVAHVQEIGRGMRSHDGKTHCDYFDPHGLFAIHGLHDPARLGDYLRKETADKEETEHIPLIDPLTGEEFAPDSPVAIRRKVRVASAAHHWIQSAAAALRCDGVIPPPSEKRQWRTLQATPAQIAMIERFKGMALAVGDSRTHPPQALADLVRAYRVAHNRRSELRSGTASDLISIILCVRRDYVDARTGILHPTKLPALLTALRRYGVTYPDITEAAHGDTHQTEIPAA